MSAFEKAWQAAGRDEDDFDPPDGAFLARLTDASAFAAKESGKNYVKLVWELLEGPDTGAQFEDFKGIDHKVGLAITREKLIMLGLDADKIRSMEELHRGVKQLIGVEATLNLSHNGQWLNTDVLTAKTGEPDVPIDMPKDDDAKDEKVPF